MRLNFRPPSILHLFMWFAFRRRKHRLQFMQIIPPFIMVYILWYYWGCVRKPSGNIKKFLSGVLSKSPCSQCRQISSSNRFQSLQNIRLSYRNEGNLFLTNDLKETKTWSYTKEIFRYEPKKFLKQKTNFHLK